MRRGSAAVSSHRDGPQSPLALTPVGQVGVEEALEDAAVVGGKEVDKLVDDDKLAEVAREGEQLTVERETTGVGADVRGWMRTPAAAGMADHPR